LVACAPRPPAIVPRTEPARKDVVTPPRRALLFRAAGFPTVDAEPIEDAVLDAATAGLPVERTTSVADLAARLRTTDFGVLVLPYGSAFPVDAWPQIRAFLRDGGGLAILGGAPFHVPVRATDATAWTQGPRQTAFAHDLLIGPAEALPIARGWREVDAGLGVPLATGNTAWALTLRLAVEKEFPAEHGSGGPREAIARPLAHVVDPSGTRRACPLLQLDRKNGARWMLATTDAKLEAPAVRAIVTRALEGAQAITIVPVHASVTPGSNAELDVHAPRGAKITVTDPAGSEILQREVSAEKVTVPTRSPGLHRVTVTAGGSTIRSAFWARDDELLSSGPKLEVSRDWLRKDGRPFPVVGTTYMASDVHRQFLFEPNPDVWDADFAEMKKLGIGFVRTGIWTGWSKVDARTVSALEAYVQTAAKHGIVVCFNFFAFLPPAYDGTNPYLDPKSLEGQRAFIASFASRFNGVSWVHWDLINEPSYAPLAKLWSTRPIGDRHEALAWQTWARERHGDGALRALWGVPEDDVYAVPRDADFIRTAVQADRRPRKARDFREFAEGAVTNWAKTMRATLRETAGPQTLVTLGQDEGGIYERATQQLMAEALDYTAVHTWWKNDDLLWDGVMTKVAGKPSLHQETGLMRLESSDGAPWRTPEDAALLLERKLGYAFAARGAGVVEWVWNVNPYMPIDEESTIGLFRPDGTAKPELDVLVRMARFFRDAAEYLDDFEPDPVTLVIPHAATFLGRMAPIEATKQIVRTLSERFGVVPNAVSDLRLTDATLAGAKLVIVPSAEVLDESAAKTLFNASRAGVKVLFTGSIEGDSYGRETPSLRALGLLTPSRPVAMLERSAAGFVTFQGLLQETLRRSEAAPVLTGNVWHEPIPLELARETEPLVRLLGSALAAAAVPRSPGDAGVAARVLLSSRNALVVVVNERPEAAVRRVIIDGHTVDVRVAARGANLLIVQRNTGKRLVEAGPRVP
jgi:hypothetical protein